MEQVSIPPIRETWTKILEYATSPLQGTLSRKQRKGVSIQINEGRVYTEAVLFLGTEFIRITQQESGKTSNTYYDWSSIASIRTESSAD